MRSFETETGIAPRPLLEQRGWLPERHEHSFRPAGRPLVRAAATWTCRSVPTDVDPSAEGDHPLGVPTGPSGLGELTFDTSASPRRLEGAVVTERGMRNAGTLRPEVTGKQRCC